MTLLLLAAVAALVGRAGWHNAEAWAVQAWDDPLERERRRGSLRSGAVGCWVVAGVLAAGGLTSCMAALV